MKKLFAIAAVAAIGAGGITPAFAGSATAQSQWNRGQAVERAKQQVPAGAKVTDTQCSERLLSDNNLWTCKVTWN